MRFDGSGGGVENSWRLLSPIFEDTPTPDILPSTLIPVLKNHNSTQENDTDYTPHSLLEFPPIEKTTREYTPGDRYGE